jgi:hypothetical protein
MGLIFDTIRSTSSISDANEHWETLFCLCESKGVANGISPAKNPKPADGTTSHPMCWKQSILPGTCLILINSGEHPLIYVNQ